MRGLRPILARSLTRCGRTPYTRATRATRRRQRPPAGGSGPRPTQGGRDTPAPGATGRSARDGQVATTAPHSSGARARPTPRHRRADRRRRPPLHGAAARRGAGGVGRAQPALQAARLAPAPARGPDRRHRPAGRRSARPAAPTRTAGLEPSTPTWSTPFIAAERRPSSSMSCSTTPGPRPTTGLRRGIASRPDRRARPAAGARDRAREGR